MRIYTDLAEWYPLLTTLDEYAEECTDYREALLAALGGGPHDLLELGAGAGHNAYWLGAEFRCTLTDLSPQMLTLCRRNHPAAEVLQGDMRSLRLGRTFDAVLVHDALCYLTTRAELRALAATVAVHLRPGGVAVLAPDDVRESFQSGCDVGGEDGGPGDDRALRYLEWKWDPDPADDTTITDYTLVMRTGDALPEVVVDRHEVCVFPEAAWHEAFQSVGLQLEALPRLGGYPLFRTRAPG